VWPERAKVAILLPLSGTWAPAGKNLRAAMELALAGTSLKPVFYDTAGSGATCAAKLQEAFLKQGASVVIGPLIKEEAQGCAPVAQQMHLPMVALTSWEEVVSAGDQVFRAYPSSNQLVQGLLRETWDVRAMKRYGVLYPKNSYGETARTAFSAALKQRGSAPVAAVGYDPASVDFRKTAQALKAALAGQAIDALFIPDAYQRVALIASALAFEDMSVGRFRAKGAPITLIGLNGWHNPELPRRGGAYVQDSIFIDAFYEDVDDPMIGGFIDAYQAKIGSPPTLVEAVGYDSVRLVAAAAGREELPDEAIRKAQVSQSLTGLREVGEDRQWGRSWRLLTISASGIEPLPVWAPDPG
jgi:ABC-type branched-subunit amino acid transport system substrate-binding protein